MSSSTKPLIAITMGDPAGVGPEIIAKALMHREVHSACRPLVVGDRRVMQRAAEVVGASARCMAVERAEDASFEPGAIYCLDLGNADPGEITPGVVQAAAGRAAYESIRRAVALVQDGSAEALATAPINKESLRAAGVSHIGHTEILGELTGVHDPLTMFQVDKLRIFFLSRHVSLRTAIDMVKKDRLVDYLKRCGAALEQLGLNEVTLAVAGLNPHCGERGMFGDEELTEIEPAIAEARAAGVAVTGPIGADSIFHQALQARFGAVLSLYHDQGHIAAKTYDFYRTVSVTLGMPILRTSVDHGTAFDIAASGKADAVGMKEAVVWAARYAPYYRSAH